jgi:hypothetical protein
MRHTTKSSWTTAKLEVLGNVTARCLDTDARMADLATEVRGEVQKLGTAIAGARTAREEVRFFREQRNQAQGMVDSTVRTVEFEVRKAAGFDIRSGAYRAVFPDGLSAVTTSPRANRVRRLAALVQAVTDKPGMESAAKALAEALTAFTTAEAAYQASRARSQAGTHTATLARNAFLAAYAVVQATVLARLKDAKAAAALFPDLRTVVQGSGAEKGTAEPAVPAAPPGVKVADAAGPTAVHADVA